MSYYSTMFVMTNAYGVSVLSMGGIHDMVDYTGKSMLPPETIVFSNPSIDSSQVVCAISRFMCHSQCTIRRGKR
jgi:hypothetical protein